MGLKPGRLIGSWFASSLADSVKMREKHKKIDKRADSNLRKGRGRGVARASKVGGVLEMDLC